MVAKSVDCVKGRDGRVKKEREKTLSGEKRPGGG